MTREELEKQCMQLPPEEREELAVRLLASSQPPVLSDFDLEVLAEAERRLDQLARGEARAIPAEEVFAELFRKFPGASRS